MAKPLHDDTAVLLIDAQTSFLEQMHGASEPLLSRLESLLLFTQLLDLPVVATLERPLESLPSFLKRRPRPVRLDVRCPYPHLPFACKRRTKP